MGRAKRMSVARQLALAAISTGLAFGAPFAAASAQEAVTETFVHLGTGVPGVLYAPAEPGDKASVAIMIMHSGGDYLRHVSCTELSKRGYTVLCANNSTSKTGRNTDVDIYQAISEVGKGVQYLRDHEGVEKIVLMGHSGGSGLFSAYQNIAENGPEEACQRAEMLIKCPAEQLADLPPADGVMWIDPNYGMSLMTLFSIDPGVVDEASGMVSDPKFDTYNPDNGYNKDGETRYGDAFIARFQQGVADRSNRIVDHLLHRLELIESGHGQFVDDEPFYVPGGMFLGFNNKLFSEDTTLLGHTAAPHELIHPDGSTETMIVPTVRAPRGSHLRTNEYITGTMKSTVKRYLAAFAVRVNDDFAYDEDSIEGVDWHSSITTPIGNAEGITVPMLAMGMTAGWEYLSAEMIYDHAASTDKTIAFVEGATHVYRPCKDCSEDPDKYGDTVKTIFDYVDGWLSADGRFM